MTSEHILIVFAGALAGGLVNGLTGFGTGLTAMGLWLYVLPPSIAASLVIFCSVVAQVQTLPIIWRTMDSRRVLPFIVPGLLGVPVGVWLLPQVDAASFKIGVGLFLVAYPLYVLLNKRQTVIEFGGRSADGAVGFCGGILGGLAGFSGIPVIIWTDLRGWTKDQRRSVIQAFNISILSVALLTHAAMGLLGADLGLAAAAALPGTMLGAWLGSRIYKRLGDRGYQRLVMMLLLVAGLLLTWTSVT